jgi:hypothetical protein
MLRAFVVAVLIVMLFPPIFLKGQELHHHEGMTAELDRFYSYWLQPNQGLQRVMGCCSHIDCYPVEARFDGTNWWYKHRESGRFLPVPIDKVEHLQSDPKESPDGRNHVCASKSGHVYCFVAGSLI